MSRSWRQHAGLGLSLLLLSCKPGGQAETDPPPLDPAVVEQGGRVYSAYCASCHGTRGEGAPEWQEPDTQGELPPPPHNDDGHTWRHADGMLYRIVRDGWRDPFNRSQRLTMPPFRDSLSPEQTRAVIMYLKTWWRPEQRRFQQAESRKEPFPREGIGE